MSRVSCRCALRSQSSIWRRHRSLSHSRPRPRRQPKAANRRGADASGPQDARLALMADLEALRPHHRSNMIRPAPGRDFSRGGATRSRPSRPPIACRSPSRRRARSPPAIARNVVAPARCASPITCGPKRKASAPSRLAAGALARASANRGLPSLTPRALAAASAALVAR